MAYLWELISIDEKLFPLDKLSDYIEACAKAKRLRKLTPFFKALRAKGYAVNSEKSFKKILDKSQLQLQAINMRKARAQQALLNNASGTGKEIQCPCGEKHLLFHEGLAPPSSWVVEYDCPKLQRTLPFTNETGSGTWVQKDSFKTGYVFATKTQKRVLLK